ncbi:MAG: YceI family protein [Flavobacterium sp.]|jgi:polyisoprenoid-binding protein YceI|nr:YceI family protein [Flavobacterium sp.]
MKKYITLFLLTAITIVQAQEKIITKNGTISFEASVPSFEEIKAKSTTASAILNTTSGEFASLVLMKSFKFKIALMEEHFNENYVESDKYPKATFKGKIQDFEYSKITTSPKSYTIKGTLEMHGKSKEITTIATIRKVNGTLEMKADFTVNTDDFNIEIPSIVSKKVSKKVNIGLEFLMK